jgi:hypothetical protein
MRGRWLGIVGVLTAGILAAAASGAGSLPSDAEVVAAFGKQGIRLSA